jgi:Ser/Thr protein kinase RdoA (MazF antagonist)
MPRGGAHFSSQELAEVLSYYDIGVIGQVKPLSAGSRRAPKMVIVSEQGKFLLKRRPKGKDDFYRVAFAHAVHSHLADSAFPVSSLVVTSEGKNTVLQLNNRVYEFFRFVDGCRYDGSSEAVADAGRQLAKFHRCLADFACRWKPLSGSFHDSTSVRRHLKGTPGALFRAQHRRTNGESSYEPSCANHQQKIVEALMTLYNGSSIRVNELGFDSWPQQIIHGDWHPGNMLFADHKVIAVLDFDSVRLAAPVTDLANGMLQFSIVGNRPNPADWPDYLDQAKLIQFLNGYREVIELDKYQLNSLLDLMIETMIAEAVLPIAATGFFGNLSGADFLKMIQRKAEWLSRNRKKLAEAITA